MKKPLQARRASARAATTAVGERLKLLAGRWALDQLFTHSGAATPLAQTGDDSDLDEEANSEPPQALVAPGTESSNLDLEDFLSRPLPPAKRWPLWLCDPTWRNKRKSSSKAKAATASPLLSRSSRKNDCNNLNRNE